MDKKKKILTSVKSLYQTAASLHEMVEDGSLNEEIKGKMIYLIESYFAETAELLDYESDLTKAKVERTVMLKAAYQDIERLEHELAESTEISGLKETMKSLIEKVEIWWTTDGFNYISGPKYTSMGSLSCNLNFMLENSLESEDLESHIQSLKNKGFVFCDGYGVNYARRLLDIDVNRNMLKEMIKERFPSSKITEWKSVGVNRGKNDEAVIQEVNILIKDLMEI